MKPLFLFSFFLLFPFSFSILFYVYYCRRQSLQLKNIERLFELYSVVISKLENEKALRKQRNFVESNSYEANIGDETDARIPWKITGNKIERDGSETRALARVCIPEQPDLIDSLTFEFKKRSSLDLRINKLTKLLPSLLVNTMESEPCHDFFAQSFKRPVEYFQATESSSLLFSSSISFILYHETLQVRGTVSSLA